MRAHLNNSVRERQVAQVLLAHNVVASRVGHDVGVDLLNQYRYFVARILAHAEKVGDRGGTRLASPSRSTQRKRSGDGCREDDEPEPKEELSDTTR